MHIRTTLRNDITSLFNTVFDPAGSVKIGTDSVNVYSGYRAPLISTEMPGVILYFKEDKSRDRDQLFSARDSRLAIEVYVKTSADTDADINYVCEQIEAVLHLNRTLNGNAEDIQYEGFDRIRDTAGAPIPGQITMNYSIKYNVTYNAAGTADNFNTAHATVHGTNIQTSIPQV